MAEQAPQLDPGVPQSIRRRFYELAQEDSLGIDKARMEISVHIREIAKTQKKHVEINPVPLKIVMPEHREDS